MGQDKSLLPLADGRPLLVHVAERAARTGLPRVLVTNTPDRHAMLGLPMVGDVRHGCGPMGGLHAALTQTDAEAVLLLACDMPNLPPDLLGALAAHAARTPDADICAPRIGGEPQPLCAVYRRRCLPHITAALDSGDYALHRFLARGRTAWLSEADLAPFDPTGQAFVNLNTPDDLARWQQNPHTAGLES